MPGLMVDAVTVDALHVGDHACLTFSDPDERLDILAAFVGDGLELGHQVLCCTESVPADKLRAELAARDVAVEDRLRDGQLAIRSGASSGSSGGEPNAAAMLDVLATELDRAAARGYAGLRVTADMGWATRPVASVEQLRVFESEVAALFADGRLTAICQYDRDSFDPVTLAFAADTHPRAVAAAVYYEDPLLRICRQHRPPGIRLAGELDYTRLDELGQALAETLRLDETSHVNLSRLRFIDVPAATVIAKAALSLPADRSMVITCGELVGTVLELVGAGEAQRLRVRKAHDQP
jgi:MEDS: MEthanogen/methylotroph, DcmR Sensory domain